MLGLHGAPTHLWPELCSITATIPPTSISLGEDACYEPEGSGSKSFKDMMMIKGDEEVEQRRERGEIQNGKMVSMYAEEWKRACEETRYFRISG